MNSEPTCALRLPRGWAWSLAALVILLGVLVRLRHLDESTLFIDEGESCINALSILEHGYPADSYLGLPVFENTLTEPWPEHAEYEFRDTSYSARGMAVYHGWLPLYAIALSLHLHGIGPDRLLEVPRVQHAPHELRQRIRAARLPAVFFGALFLLVLFLAGRDLHGEVAGLAALTLGAGSPKCIWIAQQARYYSAALALSTLCAWLIWRAARSGRPREHVLAATGLVLLFHTSSLAFAILCLAGLTLLPRLLRHPRWKRSFLLAAALLTAGILPWLLWTGYLAHSARIPMARTFLEARDYFLYLRGVPELVAGAAAALGLFTLAWSGRKRLPARLAAPLEEAAGAVGWLTTWTVAGYLGFQLFVPVASCSLGRLTHNLLAGPILLGGVGLGLLARLVGPLLAIPLVGGTLLAALLASGGFLTRQRRNPYESEAVLQVVEALRAHPFRADTRLYSLPYQHFCLTYYTGLPVQSIAPVRRAFLDSYAGEILILETTSRVAPPQAVAIQAVASAQGLTLGRPEARAWGGPLMRAMVRAELAPLVAEVREDPTPRPSWLDAVARDLLREEPTWPQGRFDYALDNPALFTTPARLSLDEFWPRFFYAFVNPEERIGPGLNYAGRLAEARAWILPSAWVWLHVPARLDASGADT